MYTIAVCDDEDAVSEKVKNLIEEWNPRVKVECYNSGEQLLKSYKPYQAVFLDIDMQGMNGIETGRQIRQIDKQTKIIYLTAYSDYAAGAFTVHAFQYLIKPVNKRSLWNVLSELFAYDEKSVRKSILDFHAVNGLICLAAEDIYYFEYVNRKVRIVTEQEEYFMVDKISTVYERMKPFGFSMPHQSFVVNMLHVKNVRNQQIYLDNESIIPLSQKKQRTWKQELTAYLSARLSHHIGTQEDKK